MKWALGFMLLVSIVLFSTEREKEEVIYLPLVEPFAGFTVCSYGKPLIVLSSLATEEERSVALEHERVHVRQTKRTSCDKHKELAYSDEMFRVTSEAEAYCVADRNFYIEQGINEQNYQAVIAITIWQVYAPHVPFSRISAEVRRFCSG